MDMLVNPAKCAGQAVNGGPPYGGLGHPLGCTGAKLSVQLFNEMRRRKQKYGVVIRRTADAWGRGRGRRVCLNC
jgi:acetyl-CoA acetyltransferase